MKSEINAVLTPLPRHDSMGGHAPPPWQLPWPCLAYAILAAVAAMTSVLLGHLALMPYALGWIEWALIIGLSAIFFLIADELIDQCSCARVVAVTAIAGFFVSALGFLILAPGSGGDLLRFLWHMLEPGGYDPRSAATANAIRFYAGMDNGVRLYFALLGICTPLTAGFAVNRSRQCLDQSIKEWRGSSDESVRKTAGTPQ